MNNTNSLPTSAPLVKNNRFAKGLKVAALILAVLAVIAAVMVIRMYDVPASLDTAETRLSEQRLFRGTYRSTLEPMTIGTIHSWVLHVETADGQPVEDAQITVDGGMPQHGHGLPTIPKATKYLGNGDYQIDGLKFNMSGWWVVEFNIEHASKQDKVIFNLMLN